MKRRLLRYSGIPDFYNLLGVDKSSPVTVIKKAYKDVVKRLHPDVAEDKNEAENFMKLLNEGYMILSDEKKRRVYDAILEDAKILHRLRKKAKSMNVENEDIKRLFREVQNILNYYFRMIDNLAGEVPYEFKRIKDELYKVENLLSNSERNFYYQTENNEEQPAYIPVENTTSFVGGCLKGALGCLIAIIPWIVVSILIQTNPFIGIIVFIILIVVSGLIKESSR